MILNWDAPPLYFMHIPKTAGGALSRLLFSVYGRRNTVSIKLPQHLARHTPESLRHYRCYACHFGPGLFDLIGRNDLLRFTVLRDPVECAISHVYFCQQQIARRAAYLPLDYLDRMQPWVNADLGELIQIPEFSRMSRNSQTRFLGHTRDCRPLLRDGESRGRPLQQQSPRSAQQPMHDNKAQVFAAACRQLAACRSDQA